MQLLQAQYRITRDKTIFDAAVFLGYCGLLMLISFYVFDVRVLSDAICHCANKDCKQVHGAFITNDAMSRAFTQTELPGVFWQKV